jgi:hypothetical protein
MFREMNSPVGEFGTWQKKWGRKNARNTKPGGDARDGLPCYSEGVGELGNGEDTCAVEIGALLFCRTAELAEVIFFNSLLPTAVLKFAPAGTIIRSPCRKRSRSPSVQVVASSAKHHARATEASTTKTAISICDLRE